MSMTSESNTSEMKPLDEMTRDELRKVAAELEIPGRGTMLKPALIEAIALERAARIEKAHRARRMNEEIERSQRHPKRGLIDGQPMPLHHNDRAMGAKHYPSPWGRPGQPRERGQAVPLTDGKRRLNYYAQNGTADVDSFTPKQRRRYAKKSIRNNVRAALASA